MSLYETWVNKLEKFNPEEAKAFFKVYYEKEKDAYADILAKRENVVNGTVAELAQRFNMDEIDTVGFIDGINTSLTEEINLEELAADSEVTLNIDWEKLYFNMHKATADWLYNLEQWDGILSEERREEIAKEYKYSLQVHVDHIGRNDPCPCGSGKKYKKCCGKNAQ